MNAIGIYSHVWVFILIFNIVATKQFHLNL